MHTFITKSLIDKHADAGIKVIEVDKTVVVTSEARDQAFKRGVELKRVEVANCHMQDDPNCPPLPPADDVKSKVRAAVIARLGFEPASLDAIISGVMAKTKS